MLNDQQVLENLGLKIRGLRKSICLSQESLAHKGDFDRTYISLIERGKRNPSLLNLIRLARTLEVTPSTLLEDIS